MSSQALCPPLPGAISLCWAKPCALRDFAHQAAQQTIHPAGSSSSPGVALDWEGWHGGLRWCQRTVSSHFDFCGLSGGVRKSSRSSQKEFVTQLFTRFYFPL